MNIQIKRTRFSDRPITVCRFHFVQTSIFTVFFVFTCFHLVAQNEDTIKVDGQKPFPFKEKQNSPSSSFFPSISPAQQFLFDQNAASQRLSEFLLPPPGNTIYKGIAFSQEKSELDFPNLGEQLYYRNNMGYNILPNLKMNLDFGLTKQNTVMSAFTPNYRLVFKSSLEYKLTPWLSSYIYGQYVTPSINQKKFFDPLQFMNPMFLQTEAGGGMRATHKNIKADVGVKIIHDTQMKGVNPAGMVNSKMTIGF